MRGDRVDQRISDNLNGKTHNYIAPFLWLHNEDDNYILREIERIYESGVRSICLESRTHDEFLKDDWWSDIELIFKECKKRDMNVFILDDKHFPSGYANGIFENKYKNLQSFGITEKHIDVSGPVKDGSVMAKCWLDDSYDEIIIVSAIRHIPDSDRYDAIIDITDGIFGDMVYFDLPEGMWRIVFVIKTRSGKLDKLSAFCDMLNPKTVDLFINEVYDPHFERFAEYFGNTFSGFFSDEPSFLSNTKNGVSPDMGTYYAHYPWNDRLISNIDKNKLPGLWFDVEGLSNEIRYAYMDIVSNEYKKNFSDKLGKWCTDHNVLYIGHVIEDNNIHAKTGKGTGHYFRAMSGQDMSGVDVVLHQIVPGLTECSNSGPVSYKHMNNDFYHYYLGKLASSAAHIDPKKRGRAMCEIFGAYGWAEGTKMMKFLMDHMLVRGINYFVPHAFSPKPNDDDCPPNFYDSGNNPQYKFFKHNMNYMNRMCHMLSDGKHIATCAVLYDAENRWINGKFLPLERIAKKLHDNLLDYDIIPVDCLDNIKNGTLNGERYNVLIVPYSENIPDSVSDKLRNADIDIILVSEKSIESDFTNITLDKLVEYMDGMKFRDVEADYNGIYLRYYHYTRNGAHIYMFSNEDINNSIRTKISLSSFNGGKYIEYDVFENKAFAKETNSDIDIELMPYNSRLIIFGDVDLEELTEFDSITVLSQKEIKDEFAISVAEGNCNQYTFYRTSKELFNITARNELTYFSGHIKYETTFETNTGNYILDLGYVGEVAELYINDVFVGSKLFPPYTFDISDYVRDGLNKLTVIVSNHNGYTKRDFFSRYLLFEPSGLLGPVSLIEYKRR
ncbi:MAG: hypothetical protein E7396_05680 [Ruminococcaceae bacterium]|nr:hypothetical protein [Oscillospiraceae bacterium]